MHVVHLRAAFQRTDLPAPVAAVAPSPHPLQGHRRSQVPGCVDQASLVAFVPVTNELFFLLTAIGNRTFQPFPMLIMASLWYLAMTSVLMVGQYYIAVAPNPAIQPANAINEAREFLIGWAMALFGLYCALTPRAMLRLPSTGADR